MLCIELQDLEVEYIIKKFSQDLTCECVKAGDNAGIQKAKSPGRPNYQDKPEPSETGTSNN